MISMILAVVLIFATYAVALWSDRIDRRVRNIMVAVAAIGVMIFILLSCVMIYKSFVNTGSIFTIRCL